jgi:hypothetical protein
VLEEFLTDKAQDGMSIRYLADIRSRIGRFANVMRLNMTDIDTSTPDLSQQNLSLKQGGDDGTLPRLGIGVVRRPL